MKCKLCKYRDTDSSLGICDYCLENHTHQYNGTDKDSFGERISTVSEYCIHCGKKK